MPQVLAGLFATFVVLLLGSAWAVVLRARQEPARQSVSRLATAGLSAASILTALAIFELVRSRGAQREMTAALVILGSAGLLTLLLCLALRAARAAPTPQNRT
jgi:uncharacterized membrane protein